jgi:MFS family permease
MLQRYHSSAPPAIPRRGPELAARPKTMLKTTDGTRVTAPELRRSRVAVFGYFFILGVATATWSAGLPAIKAALHLSDGRLGLALFAFPVGSVLTLALSGRIADRFGTVRVLRIAGLLVPVAIVPIAVAPETGDLPALMSALAVYGAMAGLLDVAMNAAAARLELGYDRPIMSSLHAGYSIAGLAGAGIGGVSAWLGIGLLPAFAATAAALVVLGLLAGGPVAATAGFALLGAGLAGIFPQIVTSAARLDPEHAGRNIGRIAAVAYSGLLTGPVAIGAIASGVGLRDALLVPAALAVLVAVAAGLMRSR